MMNDPITKVMQDASEIVRYDEVAYCPNLMHSHTILLMSPREAHCFPAEMQTHNTRMPMG